MDTSSLVNLLETVQACESVRVWYAHIYSIWYIHMDFMETSFKDLMH